MDSVADAAEFMSWLGERRDVLGLDTESGGVSPTRHRLRMVQFGDERHGWAIPFERWGGVAVEALRKYEGRMCGHNVIPYDSRVFKVNADGYDLPIERTDDGMLQAGVADSGQGKKLKNLSDRLVDPAASIGQKLLDEAFEKNGWTWDTVPVHCEPYWVYSALDPVLSVHIDKHYQPIIAADGQRAYDMERASARVCAKAMLAGLQVDTEYMDAESAKLREFERRSMAWLSDQYGIDSVNSAAQIQRVMTGLGTPIEITTPTGMPKTDKETLGAYRNHPDPRVSGFIRQVLAVRHSLRITDFYFDAFRRFLEPGDVIRASINVLAARTSRMCLPESQLLLTQRGPLHVNDVQVGDLTIDGDGAWTPVQAIHRYADAETVIYQNDRVKLEATAEHRWVTSLERKPDERRVEPLGQPRRYLHLTPPTEEVFDFRSRTVPLDGTDAVQFAALVGWLVSDGRAHDDERVGRGLKAVVYQTEGKFYTECLRCIPAEALMYDRITQSGERHHEMGIRARWLRPRLEAAGLRADPLLRTSETLLPWVLSLTLPELRAFFSAVWLADGSTAHPQNKNIACGSAALRAALQYAGYRLGLRSRTVVDKPGGWSNGERHGLHFNTQCLSTRTLTRTPGRADVWCVTTASGTLTAWGDGPYLTGNSVSEPPLQQLPRDDKMVRGAFVPRPGYVFVTVDLSQIEARLAAHFSEDEALIRVFLEADETGADFFCALAGQIFQEEIAKGDRRRSLTKNVTYGKLYAAGVEKMAHTAGVPLEQMRPVRDGFDATYHRLRTFSQQLVRACEAMDWPHVVTPTGRKLALPPSQIPTTAFNTLLQGHAAEYMKLCLIRIDAAGLGDALRMVIHDEAILEVPKEDAADVLRVVTECMTDRENYRVPITADGNVMTERWTKI